MGLNRVKGNMYGFVSHTYNVIKGKCPHGCTYCYMEKIYKRFGKTPEGIRFDEKELQTNLGKNNFIFVGSSCDMWADSVPDVHIWTILQKTMQYPDNKYLFQSKNPGRFLTFAGVFPQKYCLGTTIETDRFYPCMGDAPPPAERIRSIASAPCTERFITIEPILDFDTIDFAIRILSAKPDYVNIGADSGHNNLPEPSAEKVRELIEILRPHTRVNLKENLSRIYKGDAI